jgi:hypothetical protein
MILSGIFQVEPDYERRAAAISNDIDTPDRTTPLRNKNGRKGDKARQFAALVMLDKLFKRILVNHFKSLVESERVAQSGSELLAANSP